MGNDSIPIAKSISFKDAGYNEDWLQRQIWENPSDLGLGELESVIREKVVSSGGRLDILLKSIDDDIMYEVEVMLGETDPDHIMRTIEYWDLTRRKWPQKQHYGILIAEKVTKRFFNVIHILSNAVPLIAIQASIVDVNESRSLQFVKILDVYEEPEEIEAGSVEQIDADFWKAKSISTLNIANGFYENLKDIYVNSNLTLNRTNIAISLQGYNQMYFKKRSGNMALVVFRFGNKKDEIEAVIQENGLLYNIDPKRIKIQIQESKVSETMGVFRKIAELNVNWWQ